MNNAASSAASQAMAPVKRARVADEVLVQLVKLIVSGEIAPGDRLPPERDLAVRVGVNRTSLREALRRLETMGIISVRQGDGITVRDLSLNATLEFVKFLVSAGLGLDREFIMSLEETRRMFAVMVVGLAAERIDAAGIERLRALIKDFPREPTPELLSGEWDFAFFLEITRATGNRVFVSFLNSIKEIFGMLRWLYSRLDEQQLENLAVQNAKVVKAIAKGKKDKAVKLVETRMKQDQENLLAMLPALPATAPEPPEGAAQ